MTSDLQPVTHWCVFDDGEPACGAQMPEPPSKKPFSWPDHYPRVTPSLRKVTCDACKRRAEYLPAATMENP